MGTEEWVIDFGSQVGFLLHCLAPPVQLKPVGSPDMDFEEIAEAGNRRARSNVSLSAFA